MKDFPNSLKHDTGTVISLVANMIAIEFSKKLGDKKITELLKEYKLRIVTTSSSEKESGIEISDLPFCKFVKLPSRQKATQKNIQELYKLFGSDVNFISPIYQDPTVKGIGGMFCPLPNSLVLKLKENVEQKSMKKCIKELFSMGLKYDEKKSKYLSPYLYFQVSDLQKTNAYELKETIQKEVENVVEVLFENLPISSDFTAISNDTFYNQQWNLRQIAAAGPGTTGWDITQGNIAINIAILDSGCDMTHPDINYQGTGFNAITSTNSGANTSNSRGAAHGTACAGVAAAIVNNNRGVAGVAGGCSIIAVNRAGSSDVNTAIAINWAANNGANVISMSFGRYNVGEGRSPIGWNFNTIDPSILNAVNTQGCVVIAASGNENINTLNRYPSRHPLVIAVGASDQNDNRKNPASPDGECWGANWGLQNYNGVQTGVSVVAPGIQIPTIDIQGANGRNANNGGPYVADICGTTYPVGGDATGNYAFFFNGTSSATPQVAGLAALILSRNNTLTPQQVRNIIELNAAKVGTTAYATNANFPNGTWNQQMGYGRINVLASLNSTPLPSFKPLKEIKEFKEFKHEIKEFKEHKLEIKEIKEIKEFKEIKPEIKENFKEDLKSEIKENLKDRNPKEAKEPKEIFENDFDRWKFIDPAIQRLKIDELIKNMEGLKEVTLQMKHFIDKSKRPNVGGKLEDQ